MILRRFMKHVTDQNWFAVGLDVIVVITGIFLGLQVTEWNEDLQDRNKEKQYLQAMKADLNASIKLNEETIIKETRLINATYKLIRAAENDVIEVKLEEFDNLVFSGLFDFAEFSSQRTTYEELKNSGKLKSIGSQELLNAFGKQENLIEGLLASKREVLLFIQEKVDPYLLEVYDARQLLAQVSLELPSNHTKINAIQPLVDFRNLIKNLRFQNLLRYRYNFELLYNGDLNLVTKQYYLTLKLIDQRLKDLM